MNNIEIIDKAENSGEAVRRSIRQAAADHQAMGSLLMGLYTMKHACPLYITHGMPKEVIMPEKLMEGLANHPDVIKAHAEGTHKSQSVSVEGLKPGTKYNFATVQAGDRMAVVVKPASEGKITPKEVMSAPYGKPQSERGVTKFFAVVDDFPFYEPGKEPK